MNADVSGLNLWIFPTVDAKRYHRSCGEGKREAEDDRESRV